MFFFFQAEDGIRDVAVTGVQTCALPISRQRGIGAIERPRECGPKNPKALLGRIDRRSEEHTSELQSRLHLVCRLLLEKKKKRYKRKVNAQGMIVVKRRHDIYFGDADCIM